MFVLCHITSGLSFILSPCKWCVVRYEDGKESRVYFIGARNRADLYNQQFTEIDAYRKSEREKHGWRGGKCIEGRRHSAFFGIHLTEFLLSYFPRRLKSVAASRCEQMSVLSDK